MRKIESADSASILFEQFSKNWGGYDDATTPDWSNEEAYNISLLIKDGFLLLSRVNDAPWLGPAPDDAYAETYISLTTAGHDWLERQNWFGRAIKNISSNVASIIAAVTLALITQWVLQLFGPK